METNIHKLNQAVSDDNQTVLDPQLSGGRRILQLISLRPLSALATSEASTWCGSADCAGRGRGKERRWKGTETKLKNV